TLFHEVKTLSAFCGFNSNGFIDPPFLPLLPRYKKSIRTLAFFSEKCYNAEDETENGLLY
ncbi:MAG: hypothetical protein K2F92_07480, partial [Alistipes sp.]|nr:hypothetical protein [Alistipes sp.]